MDKTLWYLSHLIEVNLQGNSIKDSGFEGFGNVNSATSALVQNFFLTKNRITHMTGVPYTPRYL